MANFENSCVFFQILVKKLHRLLQNEKSVHSSSLRRCGFNTRARHHLPSLGQGFGKAREFQAVAAGDHDMTQKEAL